MAGSFLRCKMAPSTFLCGLQGKGTVNRRFAPAGTIRIRNAAGRWHSRPFPFRMPSHDPALIRGMQGLAARIVAVGPMDLLGSLASPFHSGRPRRCGNLRALRSLFCHVKCRGQDILGRQPGRNIRVGGSRSGAGWAWGGVGRSDRGGPAGDGRRVAGSGRVDGVGLERLRGMADQGQPPRALAAAAVLAWTTAMVRGGTRPE